MPPRQTETPAFSRSGRSSLLGKRVVPKHTVLTHETAEGLARECAAVGVTESEFIASLIEFRVHGESEIKRLTLERLARISGKARE